MAPEGAKSAQARATRKELLAAARGEFGTRGYADTSVDEIVRRAKVTKGAFYHHFSGKEDLFRRVFENVKRELSRAAFITHATHMPFDKSQDYDPGLKRFTGQTNEEVWAELVECCRRYIELHIDPKLRRVVLVDARWVLSWDEWQRIESEHGMTLLRADLRRAMHRGLIKRLPLRVLAAILSGALNDVCLMVANESDRDRALDEAMYVIEQLLIGLRLEE